MTNKLHYDIPLLYIPIATIGKCCFHHENKRLYGEVENPRYTNANHYVYLYSTYISFTFIASHLKRNVIYFLEALLGE